MRSTITYEESHYSAIISTRLTVYIMEPTELFLQREKKKLSSQPGFEPRSPANRETLLLTSYHSPHRTQTSMSARIVARGLILGAEPGPIAMG